MAKSREAFRTISEVAEWLDTPAHVLRFWESRFNQVKPVKRAGGRRYYRPNDMLLLGGIKILLHNEGITIKGVQKILREKGVKHVVGMSQPLADVAPQHVSDPVKIVAPPPQPSPSEPIPAKVIPTPTSEPLRPDFGLKVTAEPVAEPEKPAFGFKVSTVPAPAYAAVPTPAPAPDRPSFGLKVTTAVVPKVLPSHPDRPDPVDAPTTARDRDRIKSLYFKLRSLRDRMAAHMDRR